MAVSLGGDTPTYRIVRFAASALSNHLPEMAKVELSRHFDTAPENERWEVVLSNHDANSLFLAPEIVLLHAMMEEVHAGDHDEAYQKLMDDTSQVSAWFKTFALAFLRAAITRHLGGFEQWDANRKVVELVGAPSFHELTIPFFTEVESE